MQAHARAAAAGAHAQSNAPGHRDTMKSSSGHRAPGWFSSTMSVKSDSDEMKTNTEVAHGEFRIVGWREWVALPALGIDAIKAKIDTGAKTSALHAWDQERYEIDELPWVRFFAHPLERDDDTVVRCAAPLADYRWVMNSGGTRERRYVINTALGIGGETWEIELTLTNRDEMGFRMLLGREAMRGRLVVDPTQSFLTGLRAATTRSPQSIPGRRTARRSTR